MREGPFIRDITVDCAFEGGYLVIDYETCHARAQVDCASVIYEYDPKQGPVWRILLSIRDYGNPADFNWTQSVVVVRRGNDFTPLPDGLCGDLVATLHPRGDPYSYYVCAAKAARQAIRNSARDTSEPAPETGLQSAPVDPGCPCVVEGTTAHGSDTAENDTGDDMRDWFGSPSTPQSSAA